MTIKDKTRNGLEIAIIGMSAQFPKCSNYREYWKNLKAGRELIKTFSNDELKASGVDDKTLLDSTYVRSMAILENKDKFDQGFFGYSIEEASLMDPQIRIFHENVWNALEDSGYSTKVDKLKIGLFAGASSNENWKIFAHKNLNRDTINPFYSSIITAQNFISTLVSYKLNFRGPSVYLDTACSSSLVAVHQACLSLLTRESEIALAGGVSIKTQKRKGYHYKEGLVRSKDGHCRAFDKQASGTAVGEGVGVVVLKRLSEAISDNDHIYGIIKGSSINNDGNNKVGFTAPSVNGQADCIKRALKIGNVDSNSIGYIEAHGTGTTLGDPIEIRALNKAFQATAKNKFCAIGTVKSNMGHLDAAAGIAGLIKATLCLKNRQIPASLNFKNPNPDIEFGSGPFYVNTSLKNWESDSNPLRAGVSSFGIGGTNAHVVLEEPPENKKSISDNSFKILTLSAKTKSSLIRYMSDLSIFIDEYYNIEFDNIAYTYQVCRKHFSYRKAIVFSKGNELKEKLRFEIEKKEITKIKAKSPSLVFMFPGQGSQYTDMTKGLYATYPSFKKDMDYGFSILDKISEHNFHDILYQSFSQSEKNRINETKYTQPLVFLVEYALARLLFALGITPKHMIGHSLGEYVAACLSGLFSLEDALKIVVKRGALMNDLPSGEMISVAMNEKDVKDYLDDEISVAAINSKSQIVLSGERKSMKKLKNRLESSNVAFIKLRTSHAFHSKMQDSMLGEFKEELGKISFNELKLNFVSNLTGNFIESQEANSVEYWAKHLRNTVKFSEGVNNLISSGENLLFIEVGGGRSLSNLVKQIEPKTQSLNLLNPSKERVNEIEYFNNKIARIWSLGVSINWGFYHVGKERSKVSLPAYSFEPNSYITEVDGFGGQTQGNNYLNENLNKGIDQYELKKNKKSERPELSNYYSSPVTETETALTLMLQDFFGINEIGIEDNFFELGGDSLKAMVLLKKLKIKFEINFTIQDFFNCQTVKKIASEIDKRVLLAKQMSNQSGSKGEDSKNLNDSEHYII